MFSSRRIVLFTLLWLCARAEAYSLLDQAAIFYISARLFASLVQADHIVIVVIFILLSREETEIDP